MKTVFNRSAILGIASFVFTICVAGFVGCSRQAPATVPTVEVPKRTYAMNVIVSGVPFWLETKDVWAHIGAKVSGVSTEFGGPLDSNSAKQIAEIEALISRRVAGLVVTPADSAALVPIINKAVDSGIPVVTYLIDAPGSKRLTCISCPQEQSAGFIANNAIDVGGGSGGVLIVYAKAGNEEQESRALGFKNAVGKKPDLKLLDQIADNYDEATGARAIKAALIKNPGIKFVFGCNSRSAVGAVTALKELGKSPGDIVVTGWDTDEDVLDLIQGGWVQSTAAQQSAFMAGLCFSVLEAQRMDYLYSRTQKLKELGLRGIPEKIDIPIQVVTKVNASGFRRVK